MEVKVLKIDEKTWSFEEGDVRFFLLEGTEKALLIDSGLFTQNAKELAHGITKLPLELLNTHADPDHTGSNDEFDRFYMNPAESMVYYNLNKKHGKIIPVWDGSVIDLGERPLKIVTLPGHTPGSIAVIDVKNRRVFSGDPVQDGRIYMFGIHREMHAYRQSLVKLDAIKEQFDEIYPSHGTCPVSPDLIMKLYDVAGEVMEGKIKGKEEDAHGFPVTAYDVGTAVYLCDRKS